MGVAFRFSFLSFLLIGIACAPLRDSKEIQTNILTIISEKDLIPEGTAYDPKTHQVFISSIYKRKIIAIREDGSYYDFVKEAQDDVWSTLGLEVDTIRNQLWAISCKGKEGLPTNIEIPDGRWRAKLYCYNLPTGSLAGIYEVNPQVTEEFGFNDLTISQDGDVYVTESINNKIYYFQKGENYVEEFLAPKGFNFLNGITFSPDCKTLFVTSREGIMTIDVATGNYKLIQNEYTTKPNPIDGLAFNDKSLIGHQSSILTRFFLNQDMDSIVGHSILDDRDLNTSTTGEFGSNGWYYYIANSQLQTGIDYEKMTIKPWDNLEDIVIKKIRLK